MFPALLKTCTSSDHKSDFSTAKHQVSKMFATVSTKCSLTCSAPVNFWQDVQKYNFSICYSFVKISVPLTPARALETQSKSNSLLKFHKHCMQMPFGREFQNRQELQHHTLVQQVLWSATSSWTILDQLGAAWLDPTREAEPP